MFLGSLAPAVSVRQIMNIFHKSVMESAIFFAAICLGSSIRASDSKKLNKLVKQLSSVLGTAVKTLELMEEKECCTSSSAQCTTQYIRYTTSPKQCFKLMALSAPLQQNCHEVFHFNDNGIVYMHLFVLLCFF